MTEAIQPMMPKVVSRPLLKMVANVYPRQQACWVFTDAILTECPALDPSFHNTQRSFFSYPFSTLYIPDEDTEKKVASDAFWSIFL